MYIRYRTKETQARMECDRLAYHGRDNRLLVLSCHGPQQTLRGLQAVLCSDAKVKIDLHQDDNEYSSTALLKDGSGYRTYRNPLCQGVWQFLWVSKDPQLLVAGKLALGRALLTDPFTTPLLPEWVPYLERELEANGLLVNLKGEGCPSALLAAQSKDLDALVTQGIQGGDLKIG